MWRSWVFMRLLAAAGVVVAAMLFAMAVIAVWRDRFIIGALGALVSFLSLLMSYGAKKRSGQTEQLELAQAHIWGVDSRGRLPKVHNAKPMIQLGVRDAISLPEAPTVPSLDPLLPNYVQRDVDNGIRDEIRHGGLVIAQGATASGLTRIIYEAIKNCCASWNLVIPANKSTSLREISKIRGKLRKSVIFLGPIDEYVAQGGLDAHVLEALCPSGATDIVLVGTYNPTTTESRQLAEVLRRARVISVSRDLSENEKQWARKEAGEDPRVAEAIAQRREPFAQYLAIGPAVLRRFLSARDGAQPVGAAIMSAALESRRLGMSYPLTRDFLRKFHSFYLDSESSPAEFDEGIEWATGKIVGKTGCCLTLVSSDNYEPHPYLVWHASKLLPAQFPCDEMWQELSCYVQPEDMHLLGIAAFHAGRLEVAEPALLQRLSVQPDDIQASYILGRILRLTGRNDDAMSRFQMAAHSGNIDAAYHLAVLYLNSGERDHAMAWFRMADRGGHLEAKYQLGLHHYDNLGFEQSDVAQVRAFLLTAARLGHPDALNLLSKFLRMIGDVEGICEVDKIFAAETGLPSIAARGIAPRRDEFEKAMRTEAENGNVSAMNTLAVLLEQTGRGPEAKIWYTRAAGFGNQVAAENLRVVIEANGFGSAEEDAC